MVWSYHALTDVGLQVHHLFHARSLELHVDDHSVLAERLVLHHQGVNTIRQGSHSLLLSCVSFIFTFSHPHILIRHSIESFVVPFAYQVQSFHSCITHSIFHTHVSTFSFRLGFATLLCTRSSFLHLRVVLVRFVQVKLLQRFSTS